MPKAAEGSTYAHTSEVLPARALKSSLFWVESADAPTLAGVGLLFAAVALLAFWAPAMRAAKVDAQDALRGE